MKTDRLLFIWIIGLFACGILGVPLWGMLLGSLGYGIFLLLLRPYSSLFWIGYLLHGVLKRPVPAFYLYDLAYRHGAKAAAAPMIAFATLLMQKSQYAQALSVLLDVRKQKNLKPQLERLSLQHLALAYDKSGDVRKAIETMEQIRKERKDGTYLDCDFYATLAYYYIQTGEYARADELNSLALAENENCTAVYDNMGLIAYQNGELDQAQAMFLKALALDSTMVSPKYYLGCIAQARENLVAAASYFRAAHKAEIDGLSIISKAQIDEKYAQCAGSQKAPYEERQRR